MNKRISYSLSIRIILCVFLISSCNDSETDSGVKIYSLPEYKSDNPYPDLIPLKIVSGHGLNGQIYADKEYTKKNITSPWPVFLKTTGLAYYASYISIFKDRFPDNLIVLETGNIFDETNDPIKNRIILQSLKNIPLDAIAFQEQLLINLNSNSENKKSTLSFINSNILNIKSENFFASNNILPYKIVTKSGLRIAILSMIPYKLIEKNFFQKNPTFYIKDLIAAFISLKKKLEKEKVDITLLMTKTDQHCIGSSQLIYEKSKKREMVCHTKSFLKNFIKRLPPNSIDLILTSNSLSGHGFINKVPIIGLFKNTNYLSHTTIFYSKENNKIIKSKTILHPPVKLCHQFYASTQDCHIEFENADIQKKREELISKTAFQLIPAKLLGHEVLPNSKIQQIIQPGDSSNQ